MTRIAVRLGKIYDREGPGEIPEGLLRYGRPTSRTGVTGMKLWPIGEVPLLVDHDEARRIGRVRELYTFKDTDGDWLTASCDLDPNPPAWIKRGTPASFKSALLRESSFVPGHIYAASVQEVSVLLRERPAEPAARVTLLYEPKPPEATVLEPVLVEAPRVSSRHQREMDELNRRIDAAGPDADVGLIIENLKVELGYAARPWWQAA